MGGNQYPLDERIHACSRELKQLQHDERYLDDTCSVPSIETLLRVAETTNPAKWQVSLPQKQKTLARLNGITKQRRAHLRRISSFRRVLGTLEDDCGEQRQISKVMSMIVDTNNLAAKNAAQLSNLGISTRGFTDHLKVLEEAFSTG
ncbi:uncharacterized protein RCC_00316 [Ramularia collo-cygni]|uniref:Uncharacterized protein n=1 Tax=Ramularia collo-cygni TaxID=112498 RepID=A0A2D3UYR7_9PEZI|nr:uncharacterized protein RCC_00316 [Ramularia collo-cygni]CZT14339.1 uncharacterized protein RCC_00316 [Ramularia collo-cygni]